MISNRVYQEAKKRAAKMIQSSGIKINEKDMDRLEVADFGLSNLYTEGAQILSLFETKRVACRVIALFPGQTEPEHWHVGTGDFPGKEETLRVVEGELLLCMEGKDDLRNARIPQGKETHYTGRCEVVLRECDTFTLSPGVKHWFQAGKEGVVFYTMSTAASDAIDPFSDPEVVRKTVVFEEEQ